MAAAALVSLVLFAGLPGWPKIYAVLNDAAHGPVFAALAWIALRALQGGTRIRNRWTYGLAFVSTVLVGIAIEVLQGSIGRDAAWKDVATDALGAAASLGSLAWWQHRRAYPGLARLWLVVAICAAAGVAFPVGEAALAYHHRAAIFPTLARFDSRLDLFFVEGIGSTLARGPLPSHLQLQGDGESIRVSATRDGHTGIAFTEPEPNWAKWNWLHVDVTNPDTNPLEFNIRVHDAAHARRSDDRFSRRVVIPPETRTVISIAMVDIERGPQNRELNLQEVAGVILFLSGPSALPEQVFYVTRLWLDE